MRPPALVVSCSWLGQLHPAASDCVTGWTARHWGFPLHSPLRWLLFRKLIRFHHLLLRALWKMLVVHFCPEMHVCFITSRSSLSFISMSMCLVQSSCDAQLIKQSSAILCLHLAPILNFIWRLNIHMHPFYASPQAGNAVQRKDVHARSLAAFLWFLFLFVWFLATLSSFLQFQLCIDLEHTGFHSHNFA